MLRALRNYGFSYRQRLMHSNWLRHTSSALEVDTLSPETGYGHLNPAPLAKPPSFITVDYVNRLRWMINKNGIISQEDFRNIMKVFKNQGNFSKIELLSLMNFCGLKADQDLPNARVKSVEEIWGTMKKKGITPDINHYNLLLRVYLKNDYPFSPQHIEMEMAKYSLQPNRAIYTQLMMGYAKKGDLTGMSDLLEKMKENEISLNENIFHALIFGHCTAKDIGGAESIMKIMMEKGLSVNSTTYAVFLSGLAAVNDTEKFEEVYKKCMEENMTFPSEELLNIAYYLVLNNRNSVAANIISSHIDGLETNVTNFMIRILLKKNYEGFFEVVDSINDKNKLFRDMDVVLHKILADFGDIETIKQMASKLEEKGFKVSLETVLYFTLQNQNYKTSLKIIKDMHDMGCRIKHNYFRPILIYASKKKLDEFILETICLLKNDCNIYISRNFLSNYVFSYFKSKYEKEKFFMACLKKLGLPGPLILDSYLLSCFRTDRIQPILRISRFPRVPTYHGEIVNAIKRNPAVFDAEKVVQIMLKMLEPAFLQDVSDLNETNDEPVELDKNEKLIQEAQSFIDSMAIEIVNTLVRSNKQLAADILMEMNNKKLRISSEVGEKLKVFWTEEENIKVIDQLTQNNFDVSYIKNNIALRLKNDNIKPTVDNNDKFHDLLRNSMFDEAEELIKVDPALREKVFPTLISAFKKADNEEKIDEYLEKYKDEIVNYKSVLQNGTFLIELFKKGYKDELKTICGRSDFTAADEKILMMLLKPHLENGSEQEIGDLLYSSPKNKPSYMLKMLENSKTWPGMFKMIESSNAPIPHGIKVGILCRHFYNNNDLNNLKKCVDLMETKIVPNKVNIDLLIGYAYLGDFDRARQRIEQYGAPGKFINFYNIASVLRNKEDLFIIDRLKKILAGSKLFPLINFYEVSAQLYGKHKDDAEKSLALWEDLQEQDIFPSRVFLSYLEKILRESNKSIPFDFVPIPDELINYDFRVSLQKLFLSYYLSDKKSYSPMLSLIKNGRVSHGDLEFARDYLLSIEQDNGNANHVVTVLMPLINKGLYWTKWKKAIKNSNVCDELISEIKDSSDSESLHLRIPHKFFTLMLMPDSTRYIPNEVSFVIMWFYFTKVMPHEGMSKIYEPVAQAALSEEGVAEMVLKFASSLSFTDYLVNFLKEEGFVNDTNIMYKAEGLQSDEKGFNMEPIDEELSFEEEYNDEEKANNFSTEESNFKYSSEEPEKKSGQKSTGSEEIQGKHETL